MEVKPSIRAAKAIKREAEIAKHGAAETAEYKAYPTAHTAEATEQRETNNGGSGTKQSKRVGRSSKRLRWWHRYLGLVLTIPLLLFAISGILLGHRTTIGSLDVPRRLLPTSYRYAQWSHGAVRGVLGLTPDSLILYGSAGAWLTDSTGRTVRSISSTLPRGAEHRAILSMVTTPSGKTFALSSYHLYELDPIRLTWQDHTPRLECSERLTDLTLRGDSLLVLSRSLVYTASPPYEDFTPNTLRLPKGARPTVSLFRTIWTLHSGELFGRIGIAIVDSLGVLLTILLLTGIVVFLAPRLVKRARRRGASPRLGQRAYRWGLRWHNQIGTLTLVGMLLLGISGAFLRPPLLIPIAKIKHSPLPFTTQYTPNPWQDKLRTIAFDEPNDRFLLYTSDGFFWLDSLNAIPHAVDSPPYVGFMGVNVLHQKTPTEWIVGSFGGLYLWNSEHGTSLNLYTGQPWRAEEQPRIPDFIHSVAGYTEAFGSTPLVFDYHRGAETLTEGGTAHDILPMPEALALEGRISLWQLALEVHTGRIYTALPEWAGLLFIFASGVALVVILLSGYIVYRRHHRRLGLSRLWKKRGAARRKP